MMLARAEETSLYLGTHERHDLVPLGLQLRCCVLGGVGRCVRSVLSSEPVAVEVLNPVRALFDCHSSSLTRARVLGEHALMKTKPQLPDMPPLESYLYVEFLVRDSEGDQTTHSIVHHGAEALGQWLDDWGRTKNMTLVTYRVWRVTVTREELNVKVTPRVVTLTSKE